MKGAPRPKAKGSRTANNLYVASVAKAFRVLDALNRADRPLGLSDLAPLAALGRSATRRFVFKLREFGYVDQDPTTKPYTPSTKMLELGRAQISVETMRENGAPFLEAANRRSAETVNLTVLDREEVVYVLRYPSRHVVSIDLSIGSRLLAFCTAPGRAILTHLDQADAERIIASTPRKRRTRFTATSKPTLRKILASVRARFLHQQPRGLRRRHFNRSTRLRSRREGRGCGQYRRTLAALVARAGPAAPDAHYH